MGLSFGLGSKLNILSVFKKPRAIDLFSGCGGLTVGLKQAGFKVIGAVEIDPDAVETYKKNHPKISLWEGDISKLQAAKVMKQLKIKRGDLELLAGCPPCQGFSTLRTHNGFKQNRDSRNNLILEMLRFVSVLRPKSVMLENVPELANKKVFRKFCEGLREFGYIVNWDIKDASDYRVPQRRERLILLATRNKKFEFPKKVVNKKTVRQTIENLKSVGFSGDPLHDIEENRSTRIQKLIKDIPINGGSRLDLPEHRQLACHKRVNGFKDVYGRMGWDEVSPTITGGCFNPSKGRFIHPEENRAITLREAALLQTFPGKYWFPPSIGKQKVALMIGNALPPELIRRHALQLKRAVR